MKSLKRFKTQGKIPISNLIYLFEKEYYYGKSNDYVSNISMMRLTRNVGSHRCSIIEKDKDEVKRKYDSLMREKKENDFSPKPYHTDIIAEYKLIPFLNRKSYKMVRHSIIDVADKVKSKLEEFNL